MANLIECIKGGSSDARPGFLIKFDYDEGTVETLKRTVPHIEREWNPTVKTWWVSEKYQSHLLQMFTNFEALVFMQKRMF